MADAIEGYGCKCGFITDQLGKFTAHMAQAGKKAKRLGEPNEHASIGRVNMLSGESVMPAYNERSSEEKKASRNAVHKEKGKTSLPGGARLTEVLDEATELKFTPRVLTANLTPIIQTGMIAAQRVWGWRTDMPLINFLDTVIYNYFREHGIRLAAYIVEEPAGTEHKGNGHKPGNGNGNGNGHKDPIAETVPLDTEAEPEETGEGPDADEPENEDKPEEE